MEELVHPLFRANSPNPAPIAAPGTMITASPIAGQPITTGALSRMRAGTFPQNSSTHLPISHGSSRNGSVSGSSGPGSPGPSIVEEEDLPPILPGFVLSAGQRSSLVGYGKRKSVKERPSSHSQQQRMDGAPFWRHTCSMTYDYWIFRFWCGFWYRSLRKRLRWLEWLCTLSVALGMYEQGHGVALVWLWKFSGGMHYYSAMSTELLFLDALVRAKCNNSDEIKIKSICW
jgi:hypothetical protein